MMSYKQKLPKSRVNISYDMVSADGAKKEKKLPLKVMVMGDFSQGSSVEAKKEYVDREILNGKKGINAVMSKLNISREFSVPNHINPNSSPLLNCKLDMKRIDCFTPASLANNIPEVKRLLRLKEIITNFETLFDNNRSFQSKVREMVNDEGGKAALKSEMKNIEGYAELLASQKDKKALMLSDETNASEK
ncbi:type VI secretion system contractile sheath small subunit [Fangia hongkongensis]|uniref:type VI secretion system contractile sheath small subunit n=2 Tax=Fangia hongkongensis TaxID=270495 RepID=UPI0009FF572C|nr:type VI secretion system contractile sheath small subunit [Fangia hongkongensis]